MLVRNFGNSKTATSVEKRPKKQGMGNLTGLMHIPAEVGSSGWVTVDQRGGVGKFYFLYVCGLALFPIEGEHL